MVCDFYTPAEVDEHCNAATWFWIQVVLGFICMIYDYLLKTCAECGCVQNKNKYLTCCVETLGSGFLCVFFFLSCIYWIIGAATIMNNEYLGKGFAIAWFTVKFQVRNLAVASLPASRPHLAPFYFAGLGLHVFLRHPHLHFDRGQAEENV